MNKKEKNCRPMIFSFIKKIEVSRMIIIIIIGVDSVVTELAKKIKIKKIKSILCF